MNFCTRNTKKNLSDCKVIAYLFIENIGVYVPAYIHYASTWMRNSCLYHLDGKSCFCPGSFVWAQLLYKPYLLKLNFIFVLFSFIIFLHRNFKTFTIIFFLNSWDNIRIFMMWFKDLHLKTELVFMFCYCVTPIFCDLRDCHMHFLKNIPIMISIA